MQAIYKYRTLFERAKEKSKITFYAKDTLEFGTGRRSLIHCSFVVVVVYYHCYLYESGTHDKYFKILSSIYYSKI